jgi:hypothetical protein
MINWLVQEKGLTRGGSYILSSIAANLEIIKAVDMPHFGLLVVFRWVYLLDRRMFNKMKHRPKVQEGRRFFFSLMNRDAPHNSSLFFLKSPFLLLAPCGVGLFSRLLPLSI